MHRKFKKHRKVILAIKKPVSKEKLHTQSASVPLNIARNDRISFSVLRNEKNHIRKIENISYEIMINEKWEWVARYDDHGGFGLLHRHVRISLEDERVVESNDGIRKYKNKDCQLTWACKDIRRNYLIFRNKFLKNSRLDLY